MRSTSITKTSSNKYLARVDRCWRLRLGQLIDVRMKHAEASTLLLEVKRQNHVYRGKMQKVLQICCLLKSSVSDLLANR